MTRPAIENGQTDRRRSVSDRLTGIDYALSSSPVAEHFAYFPACSEPTREGRHAFESNNARAFPLCLRINDRNAHSVRPTR